LSDPDASVMDSAAMPVAGLAAASDAEKTGAPAKVVKAVKVVGLASTSPAPTVKGMYPVVVAVTLPTTAHAVDAHTGEAALGTYTYTPAGTVTLAPAGEFSGMDGGPPAPPPPVTSDAGRVGHAVAVVDGADDDEAPADGDGDDVGAGDVEADADDEGDAEAAGEAEGTAVADAKGDDVADAVATDAAAKNLTSSRYR